MIQKLIKNWVSGGSQLGEYGADASTMGIITSGLSVALTLILFLIALALVVFQPLPVAAAQKPVRFQWDYEEAKLSEVAEFRLFQRPGNGEYNYDNPIIVIPVDAANTRAGDTITYDQSVTINIPNDADGTLHFVMRAADADGNESGDSNEEVLPYDTKAPPTVIRFQLIIDTQ